MSLAQASRADFTLRGSALSGLLRERSPGRSAQLLILATQAAARFENPMAKKSVLKKRPPLEAERELPGAQERPTGPDESWRRIALARAPAFDQCVPAYIL